MDSPIDMKAGIALLGKMDIIEFAVQAAMTGDNGPLTSSPNQRRSMALLLADTAASFAALATRIDPLAEPVGDDKLIRWEAIRAVTEPHGIKLNIASTPRPDGPRLFELPACAFEESMERVGTANYLAESNG